MGARPRGHVRGSGTAATSTTSAATSSTSATARLRKGYLEPWGGALLGALVGGLGTGLIGGLAVLAAAGLSNPGDLC